MSDVYCEECPHDGLEHTPQAGCTRCGCRVGERVRVPSMEDVLARCAELENALNWHTSCLSCAKVLDSSIVHYERAEEAEKKLAALHKEHKLCRLMCNGHPAMIKDLEEELEGARSSIDHMAKAMSWVSGHDRSGLDHLEEAQYEARARENAADQAKAWARKAGALQAKIDLVREKAVEWAKMVPSDDDDRVEVATTVAAADIGRYILALWDGP